MKLIYKIKRFFRRLFSRKRVLKYADEFRKKENIKKTEKDNFDFEIQKKKNTAQVMKNTKVDDERIISKLTVRKLQPNEQQYLQKQIKEFNLSKINKSNYKQYCLGTRKYKNKVYSIISLYRITGKKRSDFKYIIVLLHSKNSNPEAKMKNKYNLYIDFNNEPYYGNYYRLYKNEKFKDKIWNKIEKLHNQEEYEKNNKKGRN